MNFKHSRRNVRLSADSGNSSCYSPIRKFNNTSVADVGSVPWLLTVWLWVVIIDKAFCFYYIAHGPFVCLCTTFHRTSAVFPYVIHDCQYMCLSGHILNFQLAYVHRFIAK